MCMYQASYRFAHKDKGTASMVEQMITIKCLKGTKLARLKLLTYRQRQGVQTARRRCVSYWSGTDWTRDRRQVVGSNRC